VDLKRVEVVDVKDLKEVMIDLKQAEAMNVKTAEEVGSRTRTRLQIKTGGDGCCDRYDHALT